MADQWARVSATNLERIRTAFDEMVAQGETPTPGELAERTGLARSSIQLVLRQVSWWTRGHKRAAIRKQRARQHRPPEELFWSHVDKSGECWLWTGALDSHGYGLFHIPPTTKTVKATRYMWEMLNGSIPQGLRLCHCCDTPHCVRPDHLFLGTQRDNMRDCAQKGRLGVQQRPGTIPSRKLTDEQIATIRAIYANGKPRYGTQKRLAIEFGVTDSAIRNAAYGRTHAHLL